MYCGGFEATWSYEIPTSEIHTTAEYNPMLPVVTSLSSLQLKDAVMHDRFRPAIFFCHDGGFSSLLISSVHVIVISGLPSARQQVSPNSKHLAGDACCKSIHLPRILLHLPTI